MEFHLKQLLIPQAMSEQPVLSNSFGKVPQWIEKYGKETCFFCTNDAHTEPLLKQLFAYGGMFIEQTLPSPLMGYPGL